jgi:hypothetical protein
MAASGFTPISLYYSTTASAVPTSGNLANGELGLNIADMKLYAKNSAGTVTLLASSSSTGATVSSVSGTGTVNGLTLTGTVTTSGSLTLGGTLSLVSPPPIGSTSPNTGAFTTITATGNITSGGILQALGTVQSSASADLSLNANGANRDVFLKVNGTTLMTVQGSTANVGIGTVSPAKRLQIADSSGDVLRLQRNDAFTGLWDIKIGQLVTGDFTIRDAENSVNALVIEKGASIANAIYVKNTGNVGVGTATPSSAFQISRTATIIKSTSTGDNSTYIQYEANNGAGSPFYVGQDSSTGGSFGKGAYASVVWQVGAYPIIFATSNTERLRFASTGAFGLSGANYGTAGQVLTSGGSGAAPTWATAGGGGQAFLAFGSTGGL